MTGKRLALCASPVEGFDKALLGKVLIPQPSKRFVLVVEVAVKNVVVALDHAGELLDSEIVVAEVERSKVRSYRKAKLETHLGVTHEVAVLFAIVSNGQDRQSTRARLIGRLDHQRHKGRVFDAEIKAVVPPSGLFEDFEDGLHHATCASSASAISSVRDGSNAARMTAAVCCITSKLSARSEAFPWYR